MTQEELIREITKRVVEDTQFWIALIGLIGVLTGSFVTIAGNIFLNWLQGKRQKKLDAARENLLRQMLGKNDWRTLSTLSRVIGADADETKRLLIAINARGSELSKDDNDEVWGLISKHPLDQVK